MNYCVKHSQFYDQYCVYCGFPPININTTTGIGCDECRKTTNRKCPKHSTNYEEPIP